MKLLQSLVFLHFAVVVAAGLQLQPNFLLRQSLEMQLPMPPERPPITVGLSHCQPPAAVEFVILTVIDQEGMVGIMMKVQTKLDHPHPVVKCKMINYYQMGARIMRWLLHFCYTSESTVTYCLPLVTLLFPVIPPYEESPSVHAAEQTLLLCI